MARTMLKKRKLRESEGSVEDRLSSLPNDVLHQILSNLSTKDSVSTSVLSKRWEKLWKYVPALDLNSDDFSDYWDLEEFFESFMDFNKDQNLNVERFKLIYNPIEHSQSYFESLIDDVVESGVRHFTVLNKVDGDEDSVGMPLSLYSCATLVNLTLFCVIFDSPESQVVSLPYLKTLHLEAVKFDGHSVLETLISSCSVLNELTIITHHGDFLEDICVRSPSLKCFKLESMREVFDVECGDPSVEVDAPKLEFMSITNYQYESFILHTIGSSAKVNIDVFFDVEYDDPLERVVIGDFLTAISTVREMTISARTLEEILDYSKVKQLPQFLNLSSLHVSFLGSSWKMLPTFLGCCPNLHSLDLEFDYLPETGKNKLPFVSQGFLSSLEFVQLKTPITDTKSSCMMELAKYFIRNCDVLKKVMLSESFGNIIKKVERIPKRSRCEVEMLKPASEVVSHGSSLLPMMYRNFVIPKILGQ
ncbi:F-box/FBD/LRR-repeat protein [Cardamine amara subsp. amara]|uniref:F-box/FBD/LRR-repeat protein n=1 Tax=Cardamine amara subsp. amara TaxID=228776 RepID=A0ABD0ZVF4_CARAN